MDSNTSPDLDLLENYLLRIPSVKAPFTKGQWENGCWYVGFALDINHYLAWQVVQELGYVLNSLSINERLPTIFKPISPPPYLNGGPEDFLSWSIESTNSSFTPSQCVEWLEARLPRPVEDLTQWEQ